MKLYDENEAVAFIKSHVAAEDLTNDEILDVIDCIFDYYDQNDELDIDFDEDSDVEDSDVDEIIEFVKSEFPDADADLISSIVAAEVEYEDSLL